MNKKPNVKNMVLTALMIAFGIIIPTAFSFLRVVLPPAFTATIASHIPIFIAMFISPASAIFTAIGTTIGFLISGVDIVVSMRAFSHIVFAFVGSLMIRKRVGIIQTGAVCAVLHALFEALTVYLFLALGITEANGSSYVKIAFYVTGIGTIIHHCIDYALAIVLIKALGKTGMISNVPKLI